MHINKKDSYIVLGFITIIGINLEPKNTLLWIGRLLFTVGIIAYARPSMVFIKTNIPKVVN